MKGGLASLMRVRNVVARLLMLLSIPKVFFIVYYAASTLLNPWLLYCFPSSSGLSSPSMSSCSLVGFSAGFQQQF